MPTPYEWGDIDWDKFDFDDCDDEREVYLRKWHNLAPANRNAVTMESLRRRDVREARLSLRNLRYVGGRLTVHHMDYHDPSLNLWE